MSVNKIKIDGGHALRIAFLITALILLLTGGAGAAPYAYITNKESNSVSVIDTATNSVTATLNTLDYPFGVAVNPAGTKAYVAHHSFGWVSVIDTDTNVVTATVYVGGSPNGIAVNPEGTKVYVTTPYNGRFPEDSDNSVSVIDTATNTVTAVVKVGTNPWGITVNPEGTKVYAANWDSNTVSVIDAATNTVIATVDVGINPSGVAINSAGTKVYVTNYGSSTVSVIDTETNSVTATADIGSHPYGVAVNPAGTKVYSSNSGSDTVSVIDATTNTVTATVNVGSLPVGVTVNPTGTKVYVANYWSSTVSVIDTETDSVTATVNVGYGASAFGQFIGYIDTTPPTIVCGSADGFWHGIDVIIACTASDSGSGLANPDDASFSLSTNVAAGEETSSASTDIRNVCDLAGNCAMAGPISDNMVDKKAPIISILAPAGTYTLNQVVAANYSCNDSGSGVATCDGPVPNGNNFDTDTEGSKSFTVNANDLAGNTASAINNYNVIYNFNGFFQPVDNIPTLNTVKAGSAIPIKFSLRGNQGLNIFPSGYPKSQKISCDTTAQMDEINETVTAGQSSLSYDTTTDQYNYVWKTEKAWTGTCRQIIVRLDDGTDHMANFKFR